MPAVVTPCLPVAGGMVRSRPLACELQAVGFGLRHGGEDLAAPYRIRGFKPAVLNSLIKL
jgi:hypothetical protein